MIRRPIALLLTAAVFLAVVAAPVGAGTGGDDLAVERDVVYRTVEGHDLALDVYRRDDDAVYPAVLEIHGGGWVGGNKEEDEQIARGLAEAGFVVFVVEYRIAPVDPYPAAVEDVQAALVWVRTHAPEYGADPDAVGAFGGSAGGHLAALLATLDGPKVDAAVSIAGPMDLADPTVSLETVFFFASFIGCLTSHCDPADAAAASPINHVSADDAPIFLANSLDDPLVPVTQAQRMAVALAAAGVDYELAASPTGGHVPGPGPAVRAQGVDFLHERLDDDPATVVPPALPSEDGPAPAPAPTADDQSFERTLLVVAVGLVVAGGVLVALSRRRRPRRRPRGGPPGPGPTAPADSLAAVGSSPRDDAASVGRRS